MNLPDDEIGPSPAPAGIEPVGRALQSIGRIHDLVCRTGQPVGQVVNVIGIHMKICHREPPVNGRSALGGGLGRAELKTAQYLIEQLVDLRGIFRIGRTRRRQCIEISAIQERGLLLSHG